MIKIKVWLAIMWIQLRVWWRKYIWPHKILISAVIVGLIALMVGKCSYNPPYYYYVDYNDKEGISDLCKVTDAGLICKKYNGYIMVREYRKVSE